MTESAICIAADDAWKIYPAPGGAIEAVAGVSFTVRRGEFIAILGPSGCGKSTLLMMCGGLESISAGSILVDGTPMDGPRPSIGVIFQDSTLLPWKSVLDNVLFPIDILRRRRADYLPRGRELLHLAGLSGFEGHRPHQLSGGMRQRAAICRALVYDPSILLMDEPFSALDAITRDEMNDVLMDIWGRTRKTALFVTHSIREAVYLADRVLVMDRRPAKVVADVAIDLPRPRHPGMGETAQFNALCGDLRALIEHSHRAARSVAADA